MPIFRKIARGIKSLFGRKKRRYAKRRMVHNRKGRNARATGHLTVKKTEIESRIFPAANGTTFGADTFELADLTQYSEYAKLYEEFRIEKIVYQFKSLNNVSGAVPAGGLNTLGMIHTRIDTNDANPPTSIQDMMNDNTYRGTRSNKNHTRVIVPKYLVQAGTVQSKTSRGWLTCINPDGVTINSVSHYGIKWAFEGGFSSVATTSFVVEPIITYYVSFRNPK